VQPTAPLSALPPHHSLPAVHNLQIAVVIAIEWPKNRIEQCEFLSIVGLFKTPGQ